MAEWSKAHLLESLVVVVFRGSSPGMTISFLFLKAIEQFSSTKFVCDKIDLKAQFFIVKIKELTCNCF